MRSGVGFEEIAVDLRQARFWIAFVGLPFAGTGVRALWIVL
jgi:hypothetical protein